MEKQTIFKYLWEISDSMTRCVFDKDKLTEFNEQADEGFNQIKHSIMNQLNYEWVGEFTMQILPGSGLAPFAGVDFLFTMKGKGLPSDYLQEYGRFRAIPDLNNGVRVTLERYDEEDESWFPEDTDDVLLSFTDLFRNALNSEMDIEYKAKTSKAKKQELPDEFFEEANKLKEQLKDAVDDAGYGLDGIDDEVMVRAKQYIERGVQQAHDHVEYAYFHWQK